MSRHDSFHIDEPLSSSRGIDSRRTKARNIQSSTWPFPASHGKDHRSCLDDRQPILLVHGRDFFVCSNLQYHSIQPIFDLFFLHQINIPLSIFRPGQFFMKNMESESIMNTLVQDASQFPVTLQDQNAFHPLLPS